MYEPNKFLFPLPKENAKQKNDKQDNFSKPWFFDKSQEKFPFPIPSEELYPEYDWPKSLCSSAPDCKVSDDFQDLSPTGECLIALRYGCPLYLTQFSEFQSFGECSNVPIFEVGQTESQDYTEEDLNKIVKNFKELQGSHRPPLIVLGHGEDQELLKKSGLPSAGWISKVWKKGRQLFADFKDVPKQVVKAIQSGAYRFPSVEIYRNFVYDGQEFGTVLRRVALLGADIPRIKSLDDIVARYEEDLDGNNNEENKGSLFLPVMQAEYSEDEGETIWLGGKSMEKLTTPIKDLSGKFKVGEEILGSDGKIVGKLAEMADDSLVITLTAKGDNLEGEISGKDSGASATIGEPEVHDEEIELEIHEIEGAFTEGETILVKDTDISATVKNAEESKLIVLVTPEQMEELKKTGRVIVGQKSSATAKIGKYPYPEKKIAAEPIKKTEGDETVLKQLQETIAKMETRLVASETKNKELTSLAESQGQIIERTEKERSQEKRDSHFKDIELWSENLKLKGMAPAVVDELGLVNFARILDSNTPFEFAEGKEKKTLWESFSELMTAMVKKYEEGTLFIPLKNLDKDLETDEIIPVGIDPEAATLDKRVTKYAEDNKVTYTEAYKAVSDADAEKK